jgi:uncharacterized protein with HEPN domain
MNTEIRKYLNDIIESILSIENYLEGKNNFHEYQENKMLRRAIERELEIIGEALNRIDKVDKDLQIVNKTKIISLRNRVIHGYDKVDNEIIWGILKRHIPSLKMEIQKLIE